MRKGYKKRRGDQRVVLVTVTVTVTVTVKVTVTVVSHLPHP